MRSAIKEVETLREFGNYDAARTKAESLRPQVEATQFKPLLGDLLQEIGMVQGDQVDAAAAKTLEEAVVVVK